MAQIMTVKEFEEKRQQAIDVFTQFCKAHDLPTDFMNEALRALENAKNAGEETVWRMIFDMLSYKVVLNPNIVALLCRRGGYEVDWNGIRQLADERWPDDDESRHTGIKKMYCLKVTALECIFSTFWGY